MPFDPDAYLSESSGGFDPDAYLQESKETGGPGNFVNSMALGSSIGEHMLGGKTIADLGTKIGSGIVAATSAPFSDKSMGDIYDESMAASKSAEDERAIYDAKSPAADVTKSLLAGVTVAPLKRPMPKGGEVFEHGLPSGGSPINQGQFSYGKDTAKEKLMEYFSKKGMGPTGEAVKGMIKEGAEEMLPYPARVALRMKRKFGGGSP